LTALHVGLGAVFSDAFGAYRRATYGRDVTEKALRTIEDIRKTILSMPFAQSIGTVADIAAGAATLAMTPLDQMAYTSGIDSTITAKTQGTQLSARASLRERHGQKLTFDAVVWTHPTDGDPRQCGEATVTMHITSAPRP
jgi:acyl-coenzyme A thioesterase PaaI-like protein